MKFITKLWEMSEKERIVRELEKWSDRELADIGVHRANIRERVYG